MTYDPVSIAAHALHGAATTATYVGDAVRSGDEEFAQSFGGAQAQNRSPAERVRPPLRRQVRRGAPPRRRGTTRHT